MKNLYYFMLVLAVAFLSPNRLASQNTVESSFNFEGLNRTYRLYVPASYSPQQSVPLVINLHGYGSNNLEQEQYGDFRPIADTAGFLVVHPNGTLDFNNVMHWNTFGTSTVNDVGFLSALIDTLASHYQIDLSRVYSTGMSNGGFMSYSLACSLSGKIAAVASVTGTMTTPNFLTCNPGRPIPVMHIHGTADATVPYNGNAFFVSVPSIVSNWVAVNQCNPEAVFNQLPDIDNTDGCTAEHYLYADGEAGVAVEHYKIIGGGHSWPGAPVNINITNMDFSASKVIWQFFKKFNLSGLISTSETYAGASVTISPNPSGGIFQVQTDEQLIGYVEVMDARGSLCLREQVVSNHFTINLPVAGLYFLKLQTKSGYQLSKLVVK